MAEDKKTSLSPYEGFKSYVEADINGNYIADGRPWNKEEQVKLNARIAEETQHIQQQTQQAIYQAQLSAQQAQLNAYHVQQQIQGQMNNMMQNMQHSFANMFGRR